MPRPRPDRFARAFTLRELIVALVVCGILFCLVAVSLRHVWQEVRILEESTQLRAVHQGFALWKHSNNDSYPLPRVEDRNDSTISGIPAFEKDTTANIYSMMLFGGYCGPNHLVSLLEPNPSIRAHANYAFQSPPTAANPKLALWDPAFSVDFTNGGVGNASYAHQLPIWINPKTGERERHPRWSHNFMANEPVVSSRGPEVSALSAPGNPVLKTATSRTLGVLAPKGQWAGFIVCNDNHVEMVTSLAPASLVYHPASGARPSPDVLFYDEPDALDGVNAFLGIFTGAGPTPSTFRSIWD